LLDTKGVNVSVTVTGSSSSSGGLYSLGSNYFIGRFLVARTFADLHGLSAVVRFNFDKCHCVVVESLL